MKKQRIEKDIPKKIPTKFIEKPELLYNKMKVGDYVICTNSMDVATTLNRIALLLNEPIKFVCAEDVVFKTNCIDKPKKMHVKRK